MLTTNKKNPESNIVSSSSKDELLLHGIRIKGKSIVVELSDFDDALQPEQLHVGSLNDAKGIPSLDEITPLERKEFGTRIWHSLAQTLKHFSIGDACTIDISASSIYVNKEFTKVYLTKWDKPNNNIIESVGSIEQLYINQLTRLYAYIVTGKDLDKVSDQLENAKWEKNHLKHQLEAITIEEDLKDIFFKGLQIDGNMFISIDTLIESIKPYLHIPNPKGLLPFAATTWIALSMQTTLTMVVLIQLYAHTLA